MISSEISAEILSDACDEKGITLGLLEKQLFDVWQYFPHLNGRAYDGLNKWWMNWDESDR